MQNKKTLFTAIKPTGYLTLGHYIGTAQSWKEMQEEYYSYFCVADLHSLTIDVEPAQLKENTYALLAGYIAFGLDPQKCVIYLQSQVKEHAELAWIMNCNVGFGHASRMTQFKDAKAKGKDVSAGLFAYPMLMAADILLYDSNVVPVGVDQMQHIEITRDIAEKFNRKYGETFILPDGVVKKVGAKIMGLLDPTKKMSKTGDNDGDVIFIYDDDETIRRKFKRAVTDSLNNIKYCENQPGVSNLLTIYACMQQITIPQAEKHFEGKGYGSLKTETAEAVIEVMAPVREKYLSLKNNLIYLEEMVQQGATKAREVAQKKLKQVYKKVGLVVID